MLCIIIIIIFTIDANCYNECESEIYSNLTVKSFKTDTIAGAEAEEH